MAENPLPARLIPVINDIDGVDPALVQLGRRYWALTGFDEKTGSPIWAETTNAICRGKAYIIAAATVRATLPDTACPSCRGSLSLASRAALGRLAAGRPATRCVDCDANLCDRAARILGGLKSTRNNASPESEWQRAQRLRRARQNKQKTILRESYQIRMLPDTPIPAAPMREEVTTLALLSYAPKPAPLGPIHEWQDPLHPRSGYSSSCVSAALQAKLLLIHPDSSIDSFVWEPETFESALDEMDPDFDEEEQIRDVVLTDRYYASYTIHFTPYGHGMEAAAAAMRDHLSRKLDPSAMTTSQQKQLRDIAIEMVAEEAMRYLEVLLDEYNLPEIPENHREKLRKTSYDVAAIRSLGELYYLAWCSARDGATAAQRNPQAPKLNMTIHSINRFESRSQDALDVNRQLRHFGPKSNLELAAITRTVFLRILRFDPFRTNIEDFEWPTPLVDTEFSYLRCSVCDDTVPIDDASMWVDVQQAFQYLSKFKDPQTPNHEYIEKLLNHRPASWSVGHDACQPEAGAPYQASVPQTHGAFLSWIADLIQFRWVNGTDLRDLLTEAAACSGRFDSHSGEELLWPAAARLQK
jgi:hypothetical protein